MATISVTLGDSLTISGLLVAARQAAVTAEAAAGSVPKTIPPCLTLGQEIFTSRPATSGTASRRAASSAYSSGVLPEIGDGRGFHHTQERSFWAMKASIPTFCRPIALSMPPGVYDAGWLPARGYGQPPVTKAPMDSRRRTP